jgi:PAS domain S-box-containing protein
MMDAFDADGRCILWNRECERIFGWTLAELNAHGDPLSLFYPDPQVRKEVMESVTAMPSGTFREWRPLTKDGTERLTSWANFQLPDGTVINLGQDISERRQTEERLASYREDLEKLIDERTTELCEANLNLKQEIAERTNAENALHSQKLLLERLIASSVDGILAFDRNCIFSIWNAAMEHISGVQAERAIGKNAFDVYPFSEGTGEDKFFYEALAGEAVVARNRPCVVPETGKEGFFEGYYSPISDDSGEVVGGLGIIRDVTERHRAEEELRQKDYIIESASNVIATTDLDRKMTYVNPAFLETWGFDDPGEVLGRPFSEFWMVEERLDEIVDALQHQGKWSDEIEARKRDGNLFDVQVSAAMVRDDEGHPISLMSSSVDITERKRTQEALRKSEEMVRALVETSRDWIWAIDLDGRHTYCNPAIETILGYRPDELIGKRSLDFMQSDDRRVVEDGLPKWIAEKRGWSNLLIRWRHKDGSWRFLESNSVPILNAAGELVGFRGVDRDTSDRRRAEEERLKLERQVQHAQKLESLGVMAGGIAHDFNNLLYVILGSAELALDNLSEVSPARPLIEELETAARRAADLTRQMLAYSGRGQFEVIDLNLSELAEEMAQLIKSSISKNVEMEMNLRTGLPGVRADVAQLQQVVMNLITNAAEAVGEEESGRVKVSTATMHCSRRYLSRSRSPERPDEGEFVYIEVVDSGCGMNEEAKEKLFDPFFTTKFTGRGLGMSAVLGIVRGHDGAIMVDSEPEEGTSIRVLIPALEESAESTLGKRVDREPTEWSGQGTVLLADDEEGVRRLTKRMLEQLGFDVRIACDGREAVEAFRGHSDEFVAVLLDLSMPHMDGRQAYRELQRENAEVRVILASGYVEQEMEDRFAGGGGSVVFIQKPYRLETLREKLRAVLGA